MLLRLVLLLVLSLAPAAPAAALSLTLDPGADASSIGGHVFLSGGLQLSPSLSPGPAPAVGQLALPVPLGPFEATVDYALTDAGLDFDFQTARTDYLDETAAVTVEIFFSVDENTGYDLFGGWSVLDPSADFASFQVRLRDLTDGVDLYTTSAVTNGTPDPDFPLDPPLPGTTGSTTGVLVAGHEYRFFFDAHSAVGPPALSSSGLVAVGTGELTLAFVPEPRVAAFVAVASLALAGAGRRARPALR